MGMARCYARPRTVVNGDIRGEDSRLFLPGNRYMVRLRMTSVDHSRCDAVRRPHANGSAGISLARLRTSGSQPAFPRKEHLPILPMDGGPEYPEYCAASPGGADPATRARAEPS